jgi:hypothetical protein
MYIKWNEGRSRKFELEAWNLPSEDMLFRILPIQNCVSFGAEATSSFRADLVGYAR